MLYSEKQDYYIRLPALPRANSLTINSSDSESNNDLYITSEDETLDKLQAYLEEKRQNKQVSNSILITYNIAINYYIIRLYH